MAAHIAAAPRQRSGRDRRRKTAAAAGPRLAARQAAGARPAHIECPAPLVGVELEILGEAVLAVGGEPLAAGVIDRQRLETARGFRRGRRQRRLRPDEVPGRLDDRLDDRNGDLAAGLAAAQRAPAAGVVVADPDRDGDVAGEADEPGVVLVFGGAGLAADEDASDACIEAAVPRATTPSRMVRSW